MKRTANAHWVGTLKEGKGEISTPSTVLNNTNYSFQTRFADGIGTNPEELLAAAHAGCFSMALGATLEHDGIVANDLYTTATVTVDVNTLSVTGINLELKASLIDGVDEAKFIATAEGAKELCIISKALSVPITLNVTYA